MITFYYNPASPIARRVWITLLEKGLDFNGIILDLNGDQLQPEFLKLNPFHHVPVLVDGDLRLLESLAIMDYLDAQYPDPPLMPTEPRAIARVRMAQQIANNELSSTVITFSSFTPEDAAWQRAQENVDRVFGIYQELLDDRPYFGGDRFSLGDIVVVNGLYLLQKLGVSLTAYSSLQTLHDRVLARPVWQQTQPDDATIARFKRRVKVLFKAEIRRRSKAQ
jgi:glutathione S-transferase